MNTNIDWNLLAAGVLIGFSLGAIFATCVITQPLRKHHKLKLWGLLLLLWLPFSAPAAVVAHPVTGQAYLISEEVLSWHQARAFADTSGGHLVTFSSIIELDFVRSAFGRTEVFWLGQEEFGGQYQWVTGEELAFAYWGAEDPTPLFGHAAVFNWPNSRGFTRGYFGQVPYQSRYRAVVELVPGMVVKGGKR
jgi:Lectin C-type domain